MSQQNTRETINKFTKKQNTKMNQKEQNETF